MLTHSLIVLSHRTVLIVHYFQVTVLPSLESEVLLPTKDFHVCYVLYPP